MKKSRNIRLLALLAAVVLTLAACGSSAGGGTSTAPANSTSAASTSSTSAPAEDKKEDVVLNFSHFYSQEERASVASQDVFLTLAEEWQAANPNVTINSQSMVQADYATKIQAQAAVNELPDIFFLKGSWVSNFYESDLLLPINEYIDSYQDKDKFRDGVFDAATRDGKIYGLPNQLSITSIVYYNEKLWKDIGYDKFPDNWDDLLAAAEKFNEKGITTISHGNKDIWPAESTILSTVGDRFTGTDWTNSIIANDGKAKFTDEDFIKAVSLLQQMANNKIFNADFNTIANAQAEEMYAQGLAASTIDGHWALSYINTNGTPEVVENTRVAILPPVAGGKGEAQMISGGCGWYVSLNSNLTGAKKDAAVDFLFHTAGYELSVAYATKYGMSGPCNVEGVDMTSFPKLTQDFAKLTGSVTFTPIYDMRMSGAVIEVMNTGLQAVLNGSKTPEELGASIQAEQDKVK